MEARWGLRAALTFQIRAGSNRHEAENQSWAPSLECLEYPLGFSELSLVLLSQVLSSYAGVISVLCGVAIVSASPLPVLVFLQQSNSPGVAAGRLRVEQDTSCWLHLHSPSVIS